MAFLWKTFFKFQDGVKTLAKSSTFARDPRNLQFDIDTNRLFLLTSYNRLGRDAEEADAEEIIDMASKASLADQQQQVQDNIHSQIKSFCSTLDKIIFSDIKKSNESQEPVSQINAAAQNGILNIPSDDHPTVPETRVLKRTDVSRRLKNLFGYTLDVKPSKIPHEDAGEGLFLDGEADIGAVVAFYPGIIYSPANYQYIPGYPNVDLHNPYIITRYDGIVINAQPWGHGGETREIWDGTHGGNVNGDLLECRNPLALAHFVNHAGKGMEPNVMVCPYNFPLTEKDMRVYIPNVLFEMDEEVKMKRVENLWLKFRGSSDSESEVPILKILVLVATRAICDEEVLLDYKLSNSEGRPTWYTPVDEDTSR